MYAYIFIYILSNGSNPVAPISKSPENQGFFVCMMYCCMEQLRNSLTKLRLNGMVITIEMNQDNFNFFKGYNTRSDIKKYITKELTKNYTDAKYVCN